MSANGTDNYFADGTSPTGKIIEQKDDSPIKTENSNCWKGMGREDGIANHLPGYQADKAAPNPTEECIERTASQGQMDSDNSSASGDMHFGQMGSSRNCFECQQCNSQLGTFEQFIKHMRSAHLLHCDGSVSPPAASAKSKCKICGRHLAVNRMELNSHLAQHLLDTRTKWHCLRCHGKHFDDANELRQHLAKCHVQNIFRCSICLELFAERDDVEDHLMTNHCAKRQKFICAACEMPFDSRFAFELHIGQMHGEIGAEQIQSHQKQSKSNGTESIKGKKEQQKKNCTISSNGMVPKSVKSVQFAAHPTHSAQMLKGLKCVVCDMRCPDEFALDRHRLFEHCKVPFGNRCGVCRCPLDSIGTFVDHSLAHRNPINEEMHCVVCRQLIRGEVQLQMHGQYHLEGKKEAKDERNNGREEDNEKEENIVEKNGRENEDEHLGKKDGDVLLEKDEADDDAADEPSTSDNSFLSLASSTVDSDHNGGITPSLLPTMPTMKCPSCKMNVTTEDYGKHLLFHVMVGTLTDFGTFGDNDGGGTNCAPKNGQLGLMPMGCDRCGRTFDTFAGLNLHMLDHLRENIGEGAQKSATIMGKHRLRGRSDPFPTADWPKEQTNECDKCGQTFTSVGRFIVHRRRHKMERTLAKCRICDRRFANKIQLDEHHETEHNVKLQQLSWNK